MLSADQLVLSAWFQQSGWTAWQQERWLRKHYRVHAIVYLPDPQAREALARLQREAA